MRNLRNQGFDLFITCFYHIYILTAHKTFLPCDVMLTPLKLFIKMHTVTLQLYRNDLHVLMVLFSRLLNCRKHPQARIVTLFVRDFSRKFRAKGDSNVTQRTTLNGAKTENSAPLKAASLSWRPIIKQLLFTVPFLFVVQTGNALFEVIETKFQHALTSIQTRFDVYDDRWGQIIRNYCNCPDTLFNRRIIQLIVFSSLCFVSSMFLLRSEKLMRMFGAGASSSFFSPITSIFLHGSVPHLACNMLSLYVLTIGWHGKGPVASGSLDCMSHQHLLTFLIMSGAAVSLVCNARYALLRSRDISVGFSGSLCALLMFEIAQKPESRVSFIFTRPDRHFSAGDAGKLVVCFELVLLALSRFHRIDSFGHLVGLGFGFMYSKFGVKRWNEEIRIMTKHCDDELNSK